MNYEAYSDTELTDLLTAGDELAYIEVYNRYWERLFIHACKMLRDEEHAMDVIQDIFTALWSKREKLSINISVKTYLYTSVRNAVINSIKKSKQQEKYMDSISAFAKKGEMSTENHIIYRDFVEQIDKEVENFSPRMKTVFVLSREDGLSNKDIAKALNITDHTVKKTINRALKILRTQVSSLFL